MVELVFGESACGGLKAAFREAGKKRRTASEKTAPPVWRGTPEDVYGISLSLSIGDISENVPGEKRLKTLEWLYSVYPEHLGREAAHDLLSCAKDSLKELCDRAAAGEAIRIWYSSHPDELCGLYWFMSQLNELGKPRGQIYLVKLPEWEADQNGNVVQRVGWGEVAVGNWASYLSLQKSAPTAFQQACASHWERLRAENAPLRAILNGQLFSAPERLYDSFIMREIEKEDAVFHEARIIGQVIGNNLLGVGDAWLAHRIEELIRAGKLEAVTKAGKDEPIYHRKLKKAAPAGSRGS
ncbi:MAG: DUF1835 domain-containing protein [Clostridiales bacterium]|jgi:hypothetical protein|nr:DUF1835 domain-containing protein [Clostridiales bacterium]